MTVSDRLKSLRLKNNMTQKEVANSLNVSEVSVRCWENGTKNPSMNAIVSLAYLFSVSTDYILGVSHPFNEEQILYEPREYRLISDYQSLDSFGKEAVDSVCRIEKKRVNSGLKISIKHIPKYYMPSAAGYAAPFDDSTFEMIESPSNDADFAVVIQGNSMSPYINDGDTVLIKKTERLSFGDIGIFCVDGMLYCKHYIPRSDGSLILASANPDMIDSNVIIMSDSGQDVRCYGKVILNEKYEVPSYLL